MIHYPRSNRRERISAGHPVRYVTCVKCDVVVKFIILHIYFFFQNLNTQN